MIDEKSVQNWFVVKKVDDIQDSGRGFPMKVNVKSDLDCVTAFHVSHLKEEMIALIENNPAKSNYEDNWRDFVYEKGIDGKLKRVVQSVSRLEKLSKSLEADLENIENVFTEPLIKDVLMSITKKKA